VGTAADDVVAVVHDGRFWERAAVMRALLQPLVIELGIIERRTSNLADVAVSFGRLFSFFNHTKQTSATLLASATGTQGLLLLSANNQSPTFLTNELVTTILTHLQWRYNFYYDSSVLVLAHVLDPTRHLQGLLSKTGDRASKNSVLNALMALGMRFNVPARAAMTKSARWRWQRRRRRRWSTSRTDRAPYCRLRYAVQLRESTRTRRLRGGLHAPSTPGRRWLS